MAVSAVNSGWSSAGAAPIQSSASNEKAPTTTMSSRKQSLDEFQDDQAVSVIARALSSIDTGGAEIDWPLWMPMARAIVEHMPHDWTVLQVHEAEELATLRRRLNPNYRHVVERLSRGARRLLRDFLDPGDRAVALGELAMALREFDKEEFAREAPR